MKSRRYLQLVERESSEVSLKWKVSHTVVFVCIAMNSAIAAHAFSEIINIFNDRCILYSKPVFLINKIGYFNYTEVHEETTENTTDNTTETATAITSSEKMKPLQLPDLEPDIIFSNSKTEEKYSKDFEEWNKAEKIPDTDNYYIIDNMIYFKNSSMYGEVSIRMLKNNVSTLFTCDYVTFTPLFSIVVASVFAGIVIVYGRGGRGLPGDMVRHGWRYVYVILTVSVVLFIFFLIATNLANDGIKQFCLQFSPITGKQKCNKYMDYFTTHTKLGHKSFYVDYVLTYYTFIINTCLWAAQLLLISFRILSIADFHFHAILVKINSGDDESITVEDEEDKFQRIHRVLKATETGTKIDPEAIVDEDEESDHNTESTAQV